MVVGSGGQEGKKGISGRGPDLALLRLNSAGRMTTLPTIFIGGIILLIALWLLSDEDNELEQPRRPGTSRAAFEGPKGSFEDKANSKSADLGHIAKKLNILGNLRVITLGFPSNWVATEGDASVITRLADLAHVFLIVAIIGEESAEEVQNRFSLALPSVLKHRILPHQSTIGGVALLRQLQPNLHIELDRNMVHEQSPYLKKIVYVGQVDHVFKAISDEGAGADTVVGIASVADLLDVC